MVALKMQISYHTKIFTHVLETFKILFYFIR